MYRNYENHLKLQSVSRIGTNMYEDRHIKQICIHAVSLDRAPSGIKHAKIRGTRHLTYNKQTSSVLFQTIISNRC